MAARPAEERETFPSDQAATTATSGKSPASSGTSQALVNATTAAEYPSSAACSNLWIRDESRSACVRTNWRAQAKRSRSRGIARTWAWRSANVRLQIGYSLIVFGMTRDVAQK